MASDLVERLRRFSIGTKGAPSHPWHPSLCDEAADEIERLREALMQLLTDRGICTFEDVERIAKAALDGREA